MHDRGGVTNTTGSTDSVTEHRRLALAQPPYPGLGEARTGFRMDCQVLRFKQHEKCASDIDREVGPS